MNQTVARPTLNISAFYFPTLEGRGWNLTVPRTKRQIYSNTSDAFFVGPSDKRLFSLDYVAGEGSCQPAAVSTVHCGPHDML